MKKLASGIIIGLFTFIIGVKAASVGGIFRSLNLPMVPSARSEVVLAMPEPPQPDAPAIRSEPIAPVDEPFEPDWNAPTSPAHTASVLEVGEYHGDEVQAQTGEHWLGLYLTSRGALLGDSILKVTRVRDDVVDDRDSRVKTGKRVGVSGQAAPILLVKGARSLRPGAVSSVFAGRLSLCNTTNLDLTLNGAGYNLSVKTSDTSLSTSINRNDARLILSKGEKREQVIYDLGGKGSAVEGYWELLWAGDLDGDNKLDLYVQVGHHYNSTQRKLFLSSQAKKGKLVREVAELATSGC